MTDAVISWPGDPDWHLGVSGTRRRNEDGHVFPSYESVWALERFLTAAVENGAKYLHQGCCTGWDEAAVRICHTAKLDLLIYGHPPQRRDYYSEAAAAGSHVLLKPKEYYARNQDIVARSDLLATGPQYPEDHSRSKHSGTWMTTRFARTASLRVYACTQDGNIIDATEKI